jgi:hypothetical protein
MQKILSRMQIMTRIRTSHNCRWECCHLPSVFVFFEFVVQPPFCLFILNFWLRCYDNLNPAMTTSSLAIVLDGSVQSKKSLRPLVLGHPRIITRRIAITRRAPRRTSTICLRWEPYMKPKRKTLPCQDRILGVQRVFQMFPEHYSPSNRFEIVQPFKRM